MDYSQFKNASPELIEKASEAKSPEELTALLTENGYSVTEAAIKELYDSLQPAESGELSDDDLENVNGGAIVLIGMIKKLFGKNSH